MKALNMFFQITDTNPSYYFYFFISSIFYNLTLKESSSARKHRRDLGKLAFNRQSKGLTDDIYKKLNLSLTFIAELHVVKSSPDRSNDRSRRRQDSE